MLPGGVGHRMFMRGDLHDHAVPPDGGPSIIIIPMRASFRCLFLVFGAALFSVAACSDDETSSAGGAPQNDAGPTTSEGGSDAGNGGDTGSVPSSANLGTGPFTIVYAGTAAGIDVRPIEQGKATFEGGKLTGYEASADERPLLGNNQVNEASGDSFVAVGRWSGGTTGGKFYEVGGTGLLELPANGGLHYAIGNFTDPLPSTGPAAYTELAKTVATVSDGSVAPGTVSGTLAASFAGATTKIGFSIVLDVPGDATYTIATTGGVADVSKSEAEILSGGNVKGAFYTNIQITSNGAACGGSCSAGVDGIVAGPGAERIALVAHVYSGAGGSPKSVSGAIVFKR